MIQSVVFTEPRACALCATPFTRNARAFRHVLKISQQRAQFRDFDIWRCVTCDVGFTAPQPTFETTPLLYANESTAATGSTKTIVDRMKDALALRHARVAAAGSKARTVLVFGAGDPYLEHALTRVLPGARVVTVSRYETAAQDERSRLGGDVERQSFEAFSQSRTRFDLIFCRHVLEHTHDPKAVIADLYARLAPRGVLEVQVPNMDSALARLMGALNPGYYVPRHLFHFTRRSLRSVVPLGAFDQLGTRSLPLMGNLLADASHRSRNMLVVQLAGIPLYALQWLADKLLSTSTCLTLRIERPVCAPEDA